jgi:hypothetical protein
MSARLRLGQCFMLPLVVHERSPCPLLRFKAKPLRNCLEPPSPWLFLIFDICLLLCYPMPCRDWCDLSVWVLSSPICSCSSLSARALRVYAAASEPSLPRITLRAIEYSSHFDQRLGPKW